MGDKKTRAQAHADHDDALETRTSYGREALGIALRAVKTDAGDSVDTFEGYASLFNSRAWIGYGPDDPWGFWEQVSAGAFNRTLADPAMDCVCLFNHDMNLLLGRTSSGTLTLAADDKGLLATNSIPGTSLGRDLGVWVARGDVAGMSFSFVPQPVNGERWDVLADGTELRTLLDVDLYDVAPCVMPAYTDTTASVRAVQLGRRNAPTPIPKLGEEVDPTERDEELAALYNRYMHAGEDLIRAA